MIFNMRKNTNIQLWLQNFARRNQLSQTPHQYAALSPKLFADILKQHTARCRDLCTIMQSTNLCMVAAPPFYVLEFSIMNCTIPRERNVTHIKPERLI